MAEGRGPALGDLPAPSTDDVTPPVSPFTPAGLERLFGGIDVYLFDQLLRRRILPEHRVLDAGCGRGRNLPYLLQAGCDVCAVDRDPAAVAAVRALVRDLAPHLPPENTRVASLADLPFPDRRFDVVISCAVLHFAASERELDAELHEMWRVLAPGGLLWARLASSIGIEDRLRPLGEGRYELPDGTERFLVDEAFLLERTEALGATLLDPIKTANVQGRRCMTTWVLRKEGTG